MAKKLFYKIGEACKKVDVQPYVLRYWETEFDLLSPDKSKSGQRVYTEGDLAIIRRIKELLYDEGYTTVGAKKKLQAELAAIGDGNADSPAESESPTGKTSAKPTVEAARKPAQPEPETASKTSKPAGTSQAESDLRDGIRAALTQTREILQRLG